MPIYDLFCPSCGHEELDRYFKVRNGNYGQCCTCNTPLQPRIGGGIPLTKTFAEDRAVIDYNIRPDGKPQIITSWEQRRKLMKQYNLEEVGSKRGMPGAWS